MKAAPKKYNCQYNIPKSPEIDNILKALGIMSDDPVSKEDVIREVNSIPEFRSRELCALVEQEIQKQDKKGSPKDENELCWQFREISRIALRNGVLPVALFVHYIMKISANNTK